MLNFKELIKSIYYTLHNPQLPTETQIRLGYIFHTEVIDQSEYFQKLLEFCTSFHSLTGKRALCTFMTPVSSVIAARIRKNAFSESEYMDRVRQLSEVADLGYHGHFWQDETPLRKGFFVPEVFLTQFKRDLEWFKTHSISHEGRYSAGWWTTHPLIYQTLIENGFRFDFSLSHAHYFRTEYSDQILLKNSIQPGEAIELTTPAGSIHCVQNLIGCHRTRYPQDFIRNLAPLLNSAPRTALGWVNSHDFDLDVKNTLHCIEHLLTLPQVKWVDAKDIPAYLSQHKPRSIPLLSPS